MKPITTIIIILLLTSLSGCVGIVDSETKEALVEIANGYKANDVSKHIDTIKVQIKSEGWQGKINGTIEIYYPTNHAFKPILEIDINHGYGIAKLHNSSRGIYSKIPYLIGFNGDKLYYDAMYNNKPENTLEHPTNTPTIPFINLEFNDVVKVGGFNNMGEFHKKYRISTCTRQIVS